MSDPRPDPTAYPQDAPATQPVGSPPTEGMRPGPATSWPTWRPTPPTPEGVVQPAGQPSPAPRSEWTPPPVPAPAQKVTHVPAPGGPNWRLVVFGLVILTVGGGIVANQATGFRVSDVTTFGPSVFVLGGLLCALVGLVGIVSRRRR